jgi:UMF1 family MFS transporter
MKTTKRAQHAWAMYDWANSTYNLVIGTAIFPIFYTSVTRNADDGAEGDLVLFFGALLKNTEALSYALALGMFLVCLLAPTIAGLADYLGKKKFFMRASCYVGATACASLYFFDVKHLELSMISIVLACIGFWCSYALYNSFLPEVAAPNEQDKLSARGYSLGYIGSVLLLVINLIMIKVLGINARWCFVTVGIWWAGFAQYTFYHLPEKSTGNKYTRSVLSNGYNELLKVWKQLTHSPVLKRYLLSFFVFSMGVQTIMQMASLFGTKEIERIDEYGNMVMGLDDGQLIGAVLVVQLIARPGAMVFARCSRRLGNITTLIIALVIWAAICITSYKLVHTPVDFYVAAACIGFIMGGTQSLARSTYSKLLPQTHDHASFFSFYDVTEKIGLIIGLLTFGLLHFSLWDCFCFCAFREDKHQHNTPIISTNPPSITNLIHRLTLPKSDEDLAVYTL